GLEPGDFGGLAGVDFGEFVHKRRDTITEFPNFTKLTEWLRGVSHRGGRGYCRGLKAEGRFRTEARRTRSFGNRDGFTGWVSCDLVSFGRSRPRCTMSKCRSRY